MPDDPILSADEMVYDYSDADTFCTICGNPDSFYDEEREEYICARCLKRHNDMWKEAIARHEARFADEIERDEIEREIDRYERRQFLREIS